MVRDAGSQSGRTPQGPLSDLETELAVLARTLEGMSRRSRVYRGLDRAGYLIGRTLATAGTMSISALAGRLGLDATTVTRQVAALENAGFVNRRADPTDGRVRLVELTARGVRTTRSVQVQREARVAGLVADWSDTEVATFARLLTRLNGALLLRSGSSLRRS